MTVARFRRRAFVMLVVAMAISGAVPPAGLVSAAEYAMVTRVIYFVDPETEQVTVTVAIDFTNTYPAPDGQVSEFREIRLAIHDAAAAVAAHDATGALTASSAVSEGVNVATIGLRSPVEYEDTANLTLVYELRDGDDPAVRVGDHLVSFPAWGFGTASEVRVDLPADFEVRVDGDTLQSTSEGDRVILESGPIADPTNWLAHIGAAREPAYSTIQRAVPLDGGTVDLQVRHWDDDPEWGNATADLLVAALPLLEAAFGFPYTGQGPVVLTEAVTAGALNSHGAAGEIAVGFAEPPFTVFHQVAHLWADDLATDRWIAEGLASWAAAQVSGELDVELPHDPAAVAARLEAEAFPLAEWADADRSPEAEGWAQAMAWSLTNQAARMAGEAGLRLALSHIAAGHDAYDDLQPQTEGLASPPAAVNSRAYLDHLDAVTVQPIVERLAPTVLGDGADGELAAREEARAALRALLNAAGDWGDPDPVRSAMVTWRFSDAHTEISAAGEWLGERDRLLAQIEAAGLTAADRLSAAYRTHGGAPPAWVEINAERAVVEAYADAAGAIEDGLDPLARIGLLISPSPEERLSEASTAFAAGDLRTAADGLAGLRQDLDTATAGGLLRLLGIAVGLGAAAVLLGMAIGRRRSGTDHSPDS